MEIKWDTSYSREDKEKVRGLDNKGTAGGRDALRSDGLESSGHQEDKMITN